MTTARGLVTSAFVVLLLVETAACGTSATTGREQGAPPTSPEASAPAAARDPIPTPTPTPTPPQTQTQTQTQQGGSGDLALTTAEGYTVTANLSFDFQAVSDIRQAPPGQTDVVLTATGALDLANSTAGRDLPEVVFASSPRVFILLPTGPVCDALAPKPWRAGADTCAVNAGLFTFPITDYPQGAIPSGQQATLPLMDENTLVTVGHELRLRLSEADAPAVVGAFATAAYGLSWYGVTGPVVGSDPAACQPGMFGPHFVWTTTGTSTC